MTNKIKSISEYEKRSRRNAAPFFCVSAEIMKNATSSV